MFKFSAILSQQFLGEKILQGTCFLRGKCMMQFEIKNFTAETDEMIRTFDRHY